MARKGRFSHGSSKAAEPKIVKPAKNTNLNDAGGVNAIEDSSRGRFSPFIKYGLFGAATLFLCIVVGGAVVAWLGTVLATISSVDSETSLLTMLDSWFFPMLTISIVAALILFMVLRRIWHSLEARFN